MPKRSHLLYSAAGLVIVLLILVVANYVVGRAPVRADLTQGHLYTLSPATRHVLGKLESPVTVRLYWSRDETTVPLPIKAYARRVEDLVDEYRKQSHGKLRVEKLDPQPDSDAEDSAALDGVDAQQLPSGDRFYLGLAVSQAGQKIALPALALDRERLLEYDLTRAIARVATTEKPVIGVLSPMPVFGSPGMPMMGMPPSETSVFVTELARDFDVRRVETAATAIDPAIKVLVLINPRGVSEATQYALDQYVLRGGRLIAFLDSDAYFDRVPGMPGPAGTSSNLDKLLAAWGIKFDDTKVVADLKYVSGAGPRAMPGVLTLDATALNPEDVATQNVGTLFVPFAGSFSGNPASGLTETVLLKSSAMAALVDPAEANERGERAMRNLKPAGTRYELAVKLTGRFKTAFPDGAPKPPAPAEGQGGAAPAAAPAATGTPLAASSADGAVVLVGDSDLIHDEAAVQIGQVFGQRVVLPANGNLAFAQALVEQFAGDPALVTLRSRAVAARPFTVLRDMEAQAAQRYLGKIRELEDDLQQTQAKLQELQKGRGAGAPAILTAEQQAELERFRARSAETRRELKAVRRELRSESESLQFWTKVVNIALMPVLVALAGLAFAMSRRHRPVRI